jgi:Domain of unknown function (DUF2610)
MIPSRRLPYPGLRAFTRDESDLFFGREGCVDAMVDRLAATRFLAVLGASGTGKSSLVRTGLLDALDLGFHSRAGSKWKTADMHPGGQPMRNLAAALLEATTGSAAGTSDVTLLTTFLRQGPRSLVQWTSGGNLQPGWNLLVLVDQFEELFRYGEYAQREEAEAFSALLIESASMPDAPVHIVITMRSEYLGGCALISGLAERVSSGLYLTPRMSREQCRQATEGPAGVIGFRVESALVNRLLNDLTSFAPWEGGEGVDQAERLARRADQLPLMQHVLNRLWARAMEESGDAPVELKLSDYERIGGLSGALDAHGREVMNGLGQRRAGRVQAVFCALVSGTTLATAVRRPCRLGELVALVGASRDDVVAIVEAFRAPDCNFLRTSQPSLDSDDVIVDISHESLIRQWTPLTEWLATETRSSAAWQRLIAAEERYSEKQGDLLAGLDLASLTAWWDSTNPTQPWAARHGGRFDAVTVYMKASQSAEAARAEAERRRQLADRRRLKYYVAGLAAALAFFVGLSLWGFRETHKANLQSRMAEQRRTEAQQAEAKAAQQATVADAERRNALRDAKRTDSVLDEVSDLVFSDPYQKIVGVAELQSELMRKLAFYQSDLSQQHPEVVGPSSLVRDDYRSGLSFETLGDATQALESFQKGYEDGRSAIANLKAGVRPDENLEANFLDDGYLYAWFLLDIGDLQKGHETIQEMETFVGRYGMQSTSERLLVAHSRLDSLESRYHDENHQPELARRDELRALDLAKRAMAESSPSLEAMAFESTAYRNLALDSPLADRERLRASACSVADRMAAASPMDRRSISARVACLKDQSNALAGKDNEAAAARLQTAQDLVSTALRLAPRDQELLLLAASIENSLGYLFQAPGQEEVLFKHRMAAKDYVVQALKGRTLLQSSPRQIKSLYDDCKSVNFPTPDAELAFYKDMAQAVAPTLAAFPRAPSFAYVAADASIQIGKLLEKDPKRAQEAEASLSDAIRWFDRSEVILDLSTASEDFTAYCGAYEERAQLYGTTGRANLMLADVKKMWSACQPALDKYPWDPYLRWKFIESARLAGRVLFNLHRYPEALPYLEYSSKWGVKESSTLLAQAFRDGLGVPASEAKAKEAESLAAKQSTRTLSLMADFGGVSSRFYIFAEQWPPERDVIDDQVTWLKEMRGGTVPAAVTDMFHTALQNSRANNLAFPDLAVDALNQYNLETARKTFASAPTAANLQSLKSAADGRYDELVKDHKQPEADALDSELAGDAEQLLKKEQDVAADRVAWSIFTDQGDHILPADKAAAGRSFQRGLELADRLPQDNAADLLKRVVSYERMGDREANDGNHDGARQWYSREVGIARKRFAMAGNSDNLDVLRIGADRLYGELVNSNQAEADALDRELAEDADGLIKKTPDDATYRLAWRIFSDQGDHLLPADKAGAGRAFSRSLDMAERLPDDNAADLSKRVFSYERLGDQDSNAGNHDRARERYSKEVAAAHKEFTLESTLDNLDGLRIATNRLYPELVTAQQQSQADSALKFLIDSGESLLAHSQPEGSLQEAVRIYGQAATDAAGAGDASEVRRRAVRGQELTQQLPSDSPDSDYRAYVFYNSVADAFLRVSAPADARANYLQAASSLERYLRFATASPPQRANSDQSKPADLYGSLAWIELLAGNFSKCIDAAQQGLKLDPGALWIEANLAHGLLLTGKQQEAIVHYMNARKGRVNDRPITETTRDDFEVLKSLGFGNPAMDDILRRMAAD